ncbi:hypothetical protein Ddye_028569 [Dipteronia dyeriana]|uniref:Uncharacterized protein n=1 Tax=Dipteronia dyeriana TaxID=168575 RepID=A0AAD9TDI8_9ROSI|nr:hypothetical protein Ddye_028569 [Dipteronia dyeriana]
MWFALGKTMVRLVAREFCLCTGLKFCELTDIFSREYEVVTDGIHFRYFDGSHLLVDNIIDMFLLIGRKELTPIKCESKQDYWVDNDVDVFIDPQFEPSILIGAKEVEAEPSGKKDG